jgi:hypothetical protein
LPTLTAAGQSLNIAEVRYFPTALTKEQKQLRAKYGQLTTIGYENTVLADSPRMLLKMDNDSTTTPVTIYGADATAWGSEIVTMSTPGKGQILYNGITVNKPGPKGDTAWKFPITSNSAGWLAGTTAGKMQELWRDNTKSLTFEWMATSPSYDPAVATNPATNIFRFNVTSGNGRLTTNMAATPLSPASTSVGQQLPTLIEYWNSTTGVWQTGSLSNLGGDVSSNNQTNYSQHIDDKWHHHVLTFDRSTTNLKAYYWIDGWLSRYRDFGAGTNAQYTGTTNWASQVAWWFGTDATATATNRSVSFDNFAVYDYLLSNEQIRQHYYAYCANEPVATGVVKAWDGTQWVESTSQKVWNGTAWVDWTASYWDGTNWIAI